MVDKVVLKGKTESIRIYEVMSLPNNGKIERSSLDFYNEIFSLYEKGNFINAESAFKLYLKHKSDDKAAQLMIKRCIHFQKTGVPIGWDGTFKLLEK